MYDYDDDATDSGAAGGNYNEHYNKHGDQHNYINIKYNQIILAYPTNMAWLQPASRTRSFNRPKVVYTV